MFSDIPTSKSSKVWTSRASPGLSLALQFAQPFCSSFCLKIKKSLFWKEGLIIIDKSQFSPSVKYYICFMIVSMCKCCMGLLLTHSILQSRYKKESAGYLITRDIGIFLYIYQILCKSLQRSVSKFAKSHAVQ